MKMSASKLQDLFEGSLFERSEYMKYELSLEMKEKRISDDGRIESIIAMDER